MLFDLLVSGNKGGLFDLLPLSILFVQTLGQRIGLRFVPGEKKAQRLFRGA